MLTRLRDDEQGVAMIIAISVAFVVLLLATVVVAQSIHSLDSSGYDRERLMSVNAAEAGTNQWYAYLQTTPSLSMSVDPGCDATSGELTLSDTVQSGPSAAAYEAVGTFYGSDGVTPVSCSTFSDTAFPSFVKVVSTGTINGSPNRTLETFVRLTPNYGGFGAAILAVNGTTITNSFTITGQQRQRRRHLHPERELPRHEPDDALREHLRPERDRADREQLHRQGERVGQRLGHAPERGDDPGRRPVLDRRHHRHPGSSTTTPRPPMTSSRPASRSAAS